MTSITNLATNPSFETAGAPVTVRENPWPDSIYSWDGDTPDDGDFTYEWAGAENASVSRQRALSVAGAPGGAGGIPIQSSEWASSGSHSLRIVAGLDYLSFARFFGWQNLVSLGVLVPGKTYTISATLRTVGPVGGYNNSRVMLVQVGPDAIRSAQPDNSAGVYPISLTVPIPLGTTDASIDLYHGGEVGGPDVWWDDLLIVEGVYDGPYFDGDTPDGDGLVYTWAGVPHASASIRTGTYIPPVLDFPVAIWDGSTEQPALMTVWDGTNELIPSGVETV